MSAPRIMFYVQYLLGIGHVRRSSLIVQALCQQGAQVDVIFGGMPVPHISFGDATMHQLTPIKSADAGFRGLVKADGNEFTEQDKAERSQTLLALCDKLQPDVIVTETYPFGRRQMRFELLPLLKWVKSQAKPPVLVASIRDILQRRADNRERECVDIVQANYQHVLVHGDEAFYPLKRSFPLADEIADKVSYSGYVCPKLASEENDIESQIVVSIGGGSVGKSVLTTALALFDSGFQNDKQWLLVTGPNMAKADKADLQALRAALALPKRDNLQVVELADEFVETLNRAHVSVSMAGYNTVMDLLLTKVPAVVIPFEGEGETEQLERSKVLADGGVLQLLEVKNLTVQSLEKAITYALVNASNSVVIDNRGAEQSAEYLIKWAGN